MGLRSSWVGLSLLGIVLVATAGAIGAAVALYISRKGEASAADAAPSIDQITALGYVDMGQGVIPLNPVTPGRVVQVLVEDGQQVRKDDVLVKLDSEVARLRVQEATADLKAAQARLSEAEKSPQQHQLKIQQQHEVIDALCHQYESTRLKLDRHKELFNGGLVKKTEVDALTEALKEIEARQEIERARLCEIELHDPKADVQQAKAEVDSKQARLEQAQHAQSECELKAPGDGQILRLQVAVGDVVGKDPTQALMFFRPAGQPLVRAELEQEFAGLVRRGQRVTIEDDTKASQVWQGEVQSVSAWFTRRRSIMQEPPQFGDVRTKECLIEFVGGKDLPVIGQRVRVHIDVSKQPPSTPNSSPKSRRRL
jgi:membrane fusion protein (multidrug efflux system)